MGRFNTHITVPVDVMDIAYGLDKEEALELIGQIDQRFAEVDFTLELIKSRIKSLNGEISREEFKKWLTPIVDKLE